MQPTVKGSSCTSAPFGTGRLQEHTGTAAILSLNLWAGIFQREQTQGGGLEYFLSFSLGVPQQGSIPGEDFRGYVKKKKATSDMHGPLIAFSGGALFLFLAGVQPTPLGDFRLLSICTSTGLLPTTVLACVDRWSEVAFSLRRRQEVQRIESLG